MKIDFFGHIANKLFHIKKEDVLELKGNLINLCFSSVPSAVSAHIEKNIID